MIDIDQLLHDAEHADSGAMFARMVGHTKPAAEMEAKRDGLIAAAHALDPQHRHPSWEDCTLAVPAPEAQREPESEGEQ